MENDARHKAKKAKWYKDNKPRLTQKWQAYWRVNQSKIRARHIAIRTEAKALILIHYGSLCVCCSESNIAFLTVDHINNDGYKDRRKGVTLYRYLIAQGYPKDIKILCFNCNIGRRNNGNKCPHKLC